MEGVKSHRVVNNCVFFCYQPKTDIHNKMRNNIFHREVLEIKYELNNKMIAKIKYKT